MKLFVWDFHGVLEKGNEQAVLEVSNLILRDFGFDQQFSREEIYRLYGQRWCDYFAHLLPDTQEELHLQLQHACIRYSAAHQEMVKKHIRANEYAGEILSAVAKKHDQIVISNTATPDLHGFLELVRLTRYFSPDKVLGADAHQPHQRRYKIDILREYIQDKEFERVIIIGDSKGDIELGALPNTTTYLYRHPYLDMPDYQADFSIRSLKELEPEI